MGDSQSLMNEIGRVLVTGATGFVGSAISGGTVQVLIESSSAWLFFNPHRSGDTFCKQPADAAKRL